MDWHEIALGLMALLMAVGGVLLGVGAWVWSATVAQVTKLGDKMDLHQQSDTAEFAALHREISDNQIALMSRISGRWSDR